MRDSVKHTVTTNITHSDMIVHNIASATLALVLQIESSNWSSIFEYLLNIAKSNVSMHPCVIDVLREIFELPIFNPQIPLASIPPQIIEFLQIIFTQLSSPDVPITGKYIISDTLQKLISRLPQIFMNDQSITSLFTLIRMVIPMSDETLYRNMHLIILEIVTRLYQYTPQFFNHIYEITYEGVRCPDVIFRGISLNFWEEIWKFESKNLKNENFGFLNVTSKVALQFEPFALRFLIIEDENRTSAFDVQNPQLEDYSYITLKAFFRSVYGTQMFDEFINVVSGFVSEMLQQNGWVFQNAAVMALMSVTCDLKNDLTSNLIVNFLRAAEEFALSPIPKLADQSLRFIGLVVTYYEELLEQQPIIASIFETLSKIIVSIPPVAARGLNVLGKVCKHVSKEQVDSNFDLIFSTIFAKINDQEFAESDFASSPYNAMCCLIQSCGENSFRKLSILLERSLAMLKESFGSFSNGNEMRNFRICSLITSIIQRLEDKVLPISQAVIGILFGILNNHSTILYEEAMICFTAIIMAIGYNFEPYTLQFLSIANAAMASKSPKLVCLTAIAIGKLCKCLETRVIPYLHNEVEGLFKYITELNEVVQVTMMPQLILALSFMIDGLGKQMPINQIRAIWNFMLVQTSVSLDPESENDVEYANNLFESLCIIFASILNVLPPEVIKSRNFINEVKHRMMKIFKQIDKMHAYAHTNIVAALYLLKTLGDKIGPPINIHLHSESVTKLFKFGTSLMETNKPIAKLALDVQRDLKD
ncbi:Importin subunit beta-1 [Histomonas meleagridis]|uniref:Importin subunit beta-1 n=1 Tax=Histomonas meleagridis TaxID=135588 RepID=UPI003559B8F0|nr:Importin subunit beta-1 [Histomonas meleagridis]KAH0803894.1 Importin subunit beta-1 [Histomonas meleagridis]